MTLPIAVIVGSLALLLWSAERFVEGAACTAKHLSMPPLMIGVVVIGFGTSAPEIVVSSLAAWQGNPGIAIGNAFGSNITNIALILGLTALISPIAVRSGTLRKEFPILIFATGFAIALMWDRNLSRIDAWLLLGTFGLLLAWTLYTGVRQKRDRLAADIEETLGATTMSLRRAVTWLVIGLCLLVLSSRGLVWGAVEIAQALGVSDLMIGLTVVAIGTSLPELASSIMAARKGEHDLALGNILGSNLFNTLAVMGVAAVIRPLAIDPVVLYRDLPVMALLTFVLFLMGFGIRGEGRINRIEGASMLIAYCAYTGWVVMNA